MDARVGGPDPPRLLRVQPILGTLLESPQHVAVLPNGDRIHAA